MNTYLKANLVVLYLLALASLAVTMPWGIGPYLQRATLVLFVIHALETVVMFKHVKFYNGPLAKSIGLSLLYGLLHWLPLARAAKRSSAT
jgi:hypothetical protein